MLSSPEPWTVQTCVIASEVDQVKTGQVRIELALVSVTKCLTRNNWKKEEDKVQHTVKGSGGSWVDCL